MFLAYDSKYKTYGTAIREFLKGYFDPSKFYNFNFKNRIF